MEIYFAGWSESKVSLFSLDSGIYLVILRMTGNICQFGVFKSMCFRKHPQHNKKHKSEEEDK